MHTTLRSGPLYLLLVALLGCQNPGQVEPRVGGRAPAAKSPNVGASMNSRDSSGKPDDEQIRAHVERPEMKAAAALVQEIAKRGPLAVVLVDFPLKSGALAEVYLNAPPPLTRYFVTAAAGFDDEVMDRAIGLAFQYEMRYASDRGSVKFTLFRDGTYERESSANGRVREKQVFEAVYSRRDLKSGELKRAAARIPSTQVVGLGLAKVLSLGGPP